MPRVFVLVLRVMTVLLVLGGATLVAGAVGQSRDGGFTGVGPARFSTPTRALVTPEVEAGATSGQAADPGLDLGELAEVRIRARPDHETTPMFIGIGPTADVERYLAGAEHVEMVAYTTRPLEVSFDHRSGAQVPTDPTAQTFWVASSSGVGPLDLRWDKSEGAFSAVAMNVDGSPGVGITADVGLRFGFLLPLGVGMLAGGAVAGVAAHAGRREGPQAQPSPPTRQ